MSEIYINSKVKKSNQITEFIARTYHNETPQKDKIRNFTMDFVVDFFIKHKVKNPKFLTLPSAFWIFERSLRKRMGLYGLHPSFLGCERDYKVFEVSAMKIPKVNKREIKIQYRDSLDCYHVHNGKDVGLINKCIWDFMLVSKKQYNCIWVDTQTPISYIAEKLNYVNNVIHPEQPAIFIITVLKAREHIKIDVPRTKYISNFISNLNLIKIWEYFDTSPMLHLIFSNKGESL